MKFTNRQAGIMYAVSSGMSNKDIAKLYGLLSKTIKNHLTALMDILGAHDRTDIALWWWRHAILGEKQKDVGAIRKRSSAASKRYSLARASITKEDWTTLLKNFGDKCLSCGSKDNLTKDHVIPLSKGGSMGIENIQPLCRSCNSIKGDKSTDYRLN